MKLATEKELEALPGYAAQDGLGDKAIVHMIFYCPANGWKWLVMENDKERSGILFGLVMGWETEYGSFSIEELEDSGSVQRVLPWKPKTLGETKELMRV